MTMLGPRTGRPNASYRCRYNPNLAAGDANECGEAATLHVKLAAGEGYLAACPVHTAAALSVPTEDSHHWGDWCNVPGSLWMDVTDDGQSRCELDVSGVEPVLVAAEQIVPTP